jgi:uncharacterized protein
MRFRVMTLIFFTIFFLVIDFYFFQAVLNVSSEWTPRMKAVFRYGFWIPTVLSISALVWWTFANPYNINTTVRNLILTSLFALYFSKLFGVIILLIDDFQRGVKWVAHYFYRGSAEPLPGKAIPRSEFLSKTAIIASSLPFGAMVYGVISGAHDYRIRRLTVKLPNLPKSFDGLKVAQLSDIHAGSFFNKTAVKGGIEMLNNEKPDVVFFTGDLVNNETSEVREYIDVFNKVKAPLGIFSVTGNHDYGDYNSKRSDQAWREKNFKDLITAHKELNYDLLLNEHRFLSLGGDKIAIIGNENWGAGRFSKYGRLDEAYKGTEDAAVKLLLSHDPSHWDAQVRPLYRDIDITFSGHTHGFQFGVEVGNIKWSPSQYVYKQWAGLYQEGSQYLYVNRGFGYLGYPGRIGMPPELTIITLQRA